MKKVFLVLMMVLLMVPGFANNEPNNYIGTIRIDEETVLFQKYKVKKISGFSNITEDYIFFSKYFNDLLIEFYQNNVLLVKENESSEIIIDIFTEKISINNKNKFDIDNKEVVTEIKEYFLKAIEKLSKKVVNHEHGQIISKKPTSWTEKRDYTSQFLYFELSDNVVVAKWTLDKWNEYLQNGVVFTYASGFTQLVKVGNGNFIKAVSKKTRHILRHI